MTEVDVDKVREENAAAIADIDKFVSTVKDLEVTKIGHSDWLMVLDLIDQIRKHPESGPAVVAHAYNMYNQVVYMCVHLRRDTAPLVFPQGEFLSDALTYPTKHTTVRQAYDTYEAFWFGCKELKKMLDIVPATHLFEDDEIERVQNAITGNLTHLHNFLEVVTCERMEKELEGLEKRWEELQQEDAPEE